MMRRAATVTTTAAAASPGGRGCTGRSQGREIEGRTRDDDDARRVRRVPFKRRRQSCSLERQKRALQREREGSLPLLDSSHARSVLLSTARAAGETRVPEMQETQIVTCIRPSFVSHSRPSNSLPLSCSRCFRSARRLLQGLRESDYSSSSRPRAHHSSSH